MLKRDYLELVYRYDMAPLFDSDGEFIGTGYTAWHFVDELDEVFTLPNYILEDMTVNRVMFDSGRIDYLFIPPAEWLHDTAAIIQDRYDPEEE